MRFTDALDRNLEDIQRPPNPPAGHYIWTVTDMPEQDQITSRKTGAVFDKLTFKMAIVVPGEDVDPDLLAEYGKVEGFRSRRDFVFGDADEDPAAFERSMFRLKQFFEHLGLDPDLSVSEALTASVNAQCLGELKFRADPEDPEVLYAEIGTTTQVP